jgi:DNA-binding Lrp family transcriptional regulator
MEEILEILEKNSRLSNEEIAVMVGKTAEEVEAAIKNYD